MKLRRNAVIFGLSVAAQLVLVASFAYACTAVKGRLEINSSCSVAAVADCGSGSVVADQTLTANCSDQGGAYHNNSVVTEFTKAGEKKLPPIMHLDIAPAICGTGPDSHLRNGTAYITMIGGRLNDCMFDPVLIAGVQPGTMLLTIVDLGGPNPGSPGASFASYSWNGDLPIPEGLQPNTDYGVCVSQPGYALKSEITLL